MASLVNRYYGQLLSCIISEKTNDPILRKLSDGWMDRRTDGQMDKSDFIGHCPTNVEHPLGYLDLWDIFRFTFRQIRITFLRKIMVAEKNNFSSNA